MEHISLTGDLSTAAVIAAAGRGLGSRENFLALAALADLLNIQVAGTRGAFNLGWISHHREIGLSGARVSPSLYLAFGLSGANFHTIGMEGSGFIIAVNPDPAARIHKLANIRVVKDANLCIREMTVYVREHGPFDPCFETAAFIKKYFEREASA